MSHTPKPAARGTHRDGTRPKASKQPGAPTRSNEAVNHSGAAVPEVWSHPQPERGAGARAVQFHNVLRKVRGGASLSGGTRVRFEAVKGVAARAVQLHNILRPVRGEASLFGGECLRCVKMFEQRQRDAQGTPRR